jgi:hypothetical protein
VPRQAAQGSRLDSAAPAMGPVYLQSPTDAQISSGCSSVPIADIYRTSPKLTTAVEPSQSSSLGDGSYPRPRRLSGPRRQNLFRPTEVRSIYRWTRAFTGLWGYRNRTLHKIGHADGISLLKERR